MKAWHMTTRWHRVGVSFSTDLAQWQLVLPTVALPVDGYSTGDSPGGGFYLAGIDYPIISSSSSLLS